MSLERNTSIIGGLICWILKIISLNQISGQSEISDQQCKRIWEKDQTSIHFMPLRSRVQDHPHVSSWKWDCKTDNEPESVLGNPPKVENLQHKWSFDKGVPENILTIVSSPNLACTQSPLSQMASLLLGVGCAAKCTQNPGIGKIGLTPPNPTPPQRVPEGEFKSEFNGKVARNNGP